MCRRCTESEPHRLKKSNDYKHLRKDSIRRSYTENQTVVSTGSKTLPYDVSSDSYLKLYTLFHI